VAHVGDERALEAISLLGAARLVLQLMASRLELARPFAHARFQRRLRLRECVGESLERNGDLTARELCQTQRRQGARAQRQDQAAADAGAEARRDRGRQSSQVLVDDDRRRQQACGERQQHRDQEIQA
jgi:hypothetical protein